MCKGPGLRGSEALSQNSVAGTESGKNKAEVGRGQMFRARTRGKTLSLHSQNKGMPLKSFPGGQEAGWWMGVMVWLLVPSRAGWEVGPLRSLASLR